MKLTMCLFLTLAFSQLAAAQTATPQDAPPDLQVKAKPFKAAGYAGPPPPVSFHEPNLPGPKARDGMILAMPGEDVRRAAEAVERDTARARASSRIPGTKTHGVEMHVKNTGRKIIVLTEATLLITTDGEELASLPLTFRVVLGPGKGERITWSDRRMSYEFKERFHAGVKKRRAEARLRVELVEYDDGSVWRRPVSAP